jgi:hypothetical protein
VEGYFGPALHLLMVHTDLFVVVRLYNSVLVVRLAEGEGLLQVLMVGHEEIAVGS